MHFHPIRAILIVCCLCAPAVAAYSPPVQPQALPDGAVVRVNHRTVLVVRRSSGGTPPEGRARRASGRLVTAPPARPGPPPLPGARGRPPSAGVGAGRHV